MLRLARSLHRETGAENLCMAGGVALNCVGNGRILREGPYRKIWIQPSAGDAGGAVGAALTAWHKLEGKPRRVIEGTDSMRGGFLGPSYSNEEIEQFLRRKEAPYVRVDDEVLLPKLAGRSSSIYMAQRSGAPISKSSRGEVPWFIAPMAEGFAAM